MTRAAAAPRSARERSAAVQRARRVDPWLRALTALLPHDLDRRAPDAGGPAGRPVPGCAALAGMPIAVKGRGGARAPQTRRLVDVGCVPIATTSTPAGTGHQTWGQTDRGPTRNPWRGDRSPGGSSAGSAAAVSAGIVELGTGSDGAGSVRIPAAWCGVFGYKPTTALAGAAGLVDRSGLAVPGPLVRDPSLLAPWTAAVLGPLPPAEAPMSWTWSADLGFASRELDEHVVAIAAAAATRLAVRARLRRVDHPLALADPAPAWTTARDLSAPAGARDAAARLRATNDAALAALFTEVDLLLTPTTPTGAHGHDGPGERMSVALTWRSTSRGTPR